MSSVHCLTTSQVVVVLLLVLLVLSWRKHLQHLEKCQAKQSVLFTEGSDGAVFKHKWPRQLSRPPSVLLSPTRSHCSKQTYLLVVLTRVDDSSVRTVFRSTYGRFASKHNFTTVFPLGLSDSENVNNDVKKEHKKYGDILQSDFLDTYGNLTLKTYSYSNYVRQRCMAVRAVLKVDDDLAWNVDRMFVYLSEIADDDKVVLHCRSVKNPLVSRDVNARWYVTPEEYPYKYFPEYCLSPVYAATPKTIAALANATARIPHLWLDDVWSLGIVAWEAGATFQPLSFNVEREIFEPFLNGSVITQYFLRKLDGLYLFDTVNAKLMS